MTSVAKTLTINAKEALGTESTPGEDGHRLAARVLELGASLRSLQIDMREVAPEDLVSSFVNAFLMALEEGGVDITEARRIGWLTAYDSERERLRELVAWYVEDTKGPARRESAPPS